MNDRQACINMITQQLRTSEVLNEKLLNLFDTMPRQEFVPVQYSPFAYSDMQIPLNHNQRMMTPVEEGLLLQSLHLTGHETVLEVGTGTGFLTAMLSRLSKKVISVDYFSGFTEMARSNLASQGCDNVELITGDASQGWLEKAPYDIVIFTASMQKLTETHFLQVIPGGKLFALVGTSPCIQGQLHTVDHNEVWQQKLVFETDLPQIVDHLHHKAFIF